MEIVVGTNFHAQQTLKRHQHFCLLIEKCCLFATSNFSLLTLTQHSATRKHLFLYSQGNRSGLRRPKRIILVETQLDAQPGLGTQRCYKATSDLKVKIYKMQWLTSSEWGCSLNDSLKLVMGQPNSREKIITLITATISIYLAKLISADLMIQI